MTELSEHLAEEPVDFSVETWRITDDSSAQWALRKLKAEIDRLDDINAQAVAEIAKVENWRELVSKSHKQTVTYFENQLRDYMLRVREEEGRKSIVLPDGEVQSRTIKAKAQVADKELFLKWCLANHREGWIRTKEEPNLEAVKDAVEFNGDSVVDTLTGEVVEGLVVVEEDITVSVKVSQT